MNQKFLTELVELLKIKSISSQSEYKPDMDKASEMLRAKLESLGFKAQVMPTSLHPVVYGELLGAAENPTILIYGHYDVQPEGDLSEWTSDPFNPEIRNGNIYGRGTADDKGQLYAWIAAVETLISESQTLPVNIKFLIEGGEEMGSEGLGEFVEENKEMLKADVCVISDSHSLAEDKPMICYGLRGLVYFDIKLRALTTDVHSGIYGGNVLNPANVLANMISKLKNENHEITVPGFYDNVRKLSEEESKEISAFPLKEEDLKKETGAKVIVGENSFSIPERAGARPTLDVNGIFGGYQLEGAKTIIPATAGAKISMRLVPFQTEKEIREKFEKYIRSICPEGIELTLTYLHGAEPIIFDRNTEYFKHANDAFEKGFGVQPIYALEGGSIGVTMIVKSALGIDSILMGYGLPDDNLHGPNEKLSLSMFEKGVNTSLEFLKSFAK